MASGPVSSDPTANKASSTADSPWLTARSGSLVAFPAGVPHRNWNGGAELERAQLRPVATADSGSGGLGCAGAAAGLEGP